MRRRLLTLFCLAAALTASAQTVPTDTTRRSAMDVEMNIVVRVDSAQRGQLTDAEIARAVEDGVRKAFGIKTDTSARAVSASQRRYADPKEERRAAKQAAKEQAAREKAEAKRQAEDLRYAPTGPRSTAPVPSVRRAPASMMYDSTRTAAKPSLYERYLERQDKKGRHIERVPREDLNATFIPKGQWMFGGSISFNEWDDDNLNYLVLKNIDFEGHTFGISPYFGYFFTKNMCVGGRFNYSRYYFNLGRFDLNLGEDFNISLSDLYYLEHDFDCSAFLRTYMPLGKSKVFGFFSEIDLTYGHAKGKNTTGVKGTTGYEGTMEHVNSIQIGFCPGLTAFTTDFMAVECSIAVMGLQYKWKDQKTNQVENGKSRSGGANFKINLFSVNLGMTFYL